MKKARRTLTRFSILLATTMAGTVLILAALLTFARPVALDGATALLSTQSTGGSLLTGAGAAKELRPFGTAGPGRPSTGQEHVRIGSVTKTFVATVMLQLWEEGRVDLDAPVDRYLPRVLPARSGVTVRQLLNHTSGLYDYMKGDGWSTNRWRGDKRFDTYQPLQLVREATSHPPYFPAGTRFRYSNTNYIVAALIIEQLTGRPYYREVHDRILTPLGLDDTLLPGSSATIPQPLLSAQARGPQGQDLDVTDQNMTLDWAAGEIISTSHDLSTFLDALLTGQLLSTPALQQMQDVVPMGMGFHYGLGLERYDLPCGGHVWGHGGKLLGYLTYAYRRDDGQQLILTAASTDGDAFVPFAVTTLAAFCMR